MSTNELYVVTGATGRTGSAVAKTLLDAGKRVRVVVRDEPAGDVWTTLGAEVAVADFSDGFALCRAFSGADGAYIVSPPQYSSEDLFSQAREMAHTIAAAAKEAKLAKIVALSSIGAEQAEGTGWIAMNRMLEACIIDTGLPVVFLRAAYFMENWRPLVKMAILQRQLPSFLSPLNQKFPMIATPDIGRIAAEVLCEDWRGVRIIDLEGPDRYSPNDVAELVSLKLGEAIQPFSIPESDWAQSIAGQGFSSAAIAGFIEMTQGLNSGHIAFHDRLSIERRLGTVKLDIMIDALAAG
ncbi:NmrA family NAD(P)-binding protein [Photobacterium sp. CAU 1568]|uniref:NmrA family NAD(P)-binding protein n=1 Tax=Photobacterium arenosum TaxID=2774143 RepID=A0ABR9BGE4_9GAMM|nr:NmrA family NAD(P)-binding protein [Photobacterium arenosum]MBD8511249.1 NmrA family NAD(P)-binding protein [Photobacterium arenosum]